MADTTFVDYTIPAVNAAWLNEVNDHVHHDTPVAGTTVHGSDVIGFTQAGTGAVLRTLQAKGRDVVNVKDFGAVGDGVTDDAVAIQAAYTAATTGGEVHWSNASYKISTPISITKAVKTFFNGATVTQTGLGNAFTMSTANQTSASFSLVFNGGRLVGNAKSAGSCGISVSSNNPFVYIEDMHINGWDVGIKLADAYCSKISNTKCIANNVGVELQGAVHASTVINTFCDANTTAGLRLNYGGGFTSTHNLTIVGGAFQNSAIGMWIEQAYEPTIVNPYFEGNTNIDVRLGVADAGVYARATYNANVQTFQSGSPCSTGVSNTNIVVEHAVACSIKDAGFYAATPTHHVSVDSYSDRVLIDYWSTASASPWSVPTGVDAYRVTLQKSGRNLFPYDQSGTAKHLNWQNFNTLAALASIFFGDGFASRPSLIVQADEAGSDVLIRAGATGTVRLGDTSNNIYFEANIPTAKAIISKPLKLDNQTTGTTVGAAGAASALPATPLGYISVDLGGTAVKLPYYTA